MLIYPVSSRAYSLAKSLTARFSGLIPGGFIVSEAGSVSIRVEHLKSTDEALRDEAARLICQRFSPRLRALVRRRLDIRVRCREDEDDILQSSYASFFAGQIEGQATPSSGEELWKLLARITLCKTINTANRHTAARRDVRREKVSGHERCTTRSPLPVSTLDLFQDSTHPPDALVGIAEEIDLIRRRLPVDLQRIVIWKLEGYSNAEIAVLIGRGVRMVELKMRSIRERLRESGHRSCQDAQKPT